MKKQIHIKNKYKSFLVLYFLCFSLFFTAETFSKFLSIINVSGSLEVAVWDVALANPDAEDVSLIAGNTTQDFLLTVTSTSEIASNYSIVITNVPAGVSVKIDNGSEFTPENNVIIIPNVGSFEANDANSQHQHTITVIASIDTGVLDKEQLSLYLTFTQVEI